MKENNGKYGIKDGMRKANTARYNNGFDPTPDTFNSNEGSREGSAPARDFDMQGNNPRTNIGGPSSQSPYYAGSAYASGQGMQQPGVPPFQQGQGNDRDNKQKHKARFWIAIVVALLCIVLAILLALTMCGNQKGMRQGDLGQLEGKTAAEVQAELDRIVDEGMFNISIASVVEFPNGQSEGELRIENVPANHYLMKVAITRDDTGEQIYETDFIEPNHHIQTDQLDVVLPQGEYSCTAIFTAYDSESEEPVGQAAAKIDINVLS